MKKIMLNKEERQLEKEIESGEWKVVPNLAEEIKKLISEYPIGIMIK